MLWEGRPAASLQLRLVDFVLIPVAGSWAAFQLAEDVHGWRIGAPLLGNLFDAFLVAVAVFFAVGRIFLEAVVRSGTTYAVTSKRVAVIMEGEATTVMWLNTSNLPPMELIERRDGSGTIKFGTPLGRFGLHRFGPSMAAGHEFYRIPDVRSVYELIERQAR